MVPVRVASNAIDWTHVTVVICLISLREGRGALVDGAVLSGHEVIASWVVIREVNGETTRVNEGHSSCLRFIESSSVDILLIRVSLTLQLLQVSVLKALLHGPFDDETVSGDRDDSLGLVISRDPLDLPNDICVLVGDVF